MAPDTPRRYYFRPVTIRHKDAVRATVFCVRLYDCTFPERGVYLLELWYDGAWVVDQRLEVTWRERTMAKKAEQTSEAGGVQVFELTMDNPENQDEWNRRLRKPGESASRLSPKTGHKGHGKSTAESTGKKNGKQKGRS